MDNPKFSSPLYQQFQQLIKQKIINQDFLPGEKLPGERKLADTYKVSRMTVKRALNKLVDDGILERKVGSGTYIKNVLPPTYSLSFTKEDSFSSAVQQTTTKIIRLIEDVQSPYISKQLNLATTEPIYGLHRLRLIDDEPFAIEYTFVPQKYFHDFLTTDFRNISLYNYMKNNGQVPTRFQQYQTPVHPLESESKLLGIKDTEYVFKVNFTTANQNDELIEFTESYLNPGKVNLSYDFSVQ